MPYLSMTDTVEIRLTSRTLNQLMRDSAQSFPWNDQCSSIRIIDFHTWRRFFPRAISCNMSSAVLSVPATHRYLLSGLKVLRATSTISSPNNWTKFMFSHLTGLTSLDLSHCRLLTDDAFQTLTSLTHLSLTFCTNVTHRVLQPLSQLRSLTMHTWLLGRIDTISDQCLQHTPLLETLTAHSCLQLTDAAFTRVPMLSRLDIAGCLQLTAAALVPLQRLQSLMVCTQCDETFLSARGQAHLRLKVPHLHVSLLPD